MLDQNVPAGKNKSYKMATYYNTLANRPEGRLPIPSGFSRYSSNPVGGYKGQDIDLNRCSINNVNMTVPVGTEFRRWITGPTSNARGLYPNLRLPNGEYLFQNMERAEPMLNGKRLLYDTTLDELNPLPGSTQYKPSRQKLYPLTNVYSRELSLYSEKILPTPDY
jgi:hypothetical protein